MPRLNCDDFRHLFVNDIPLMDMRAPVEFQQGAFPTSINRAFMTDDERAAVGTCYKNQGQEEAIKLGHQLVHGEVKAARIAKWRAFCEANPNGYLYCLRGGLRSQITQQWLKEVGIDFPYVNGGYKALRRFLMDTIEEVAKQPSTVIAGNTGSGKTIMINELKSGIDLEGAAHHRGSSFGRFVTPQRTQVAFENDLAVQMLKKQDSSVTQFVYEDEGNSIGCVMVPLSLQAAMKDAPIVVIDDPMEVRLARLLDDYVITMQRDYVAEYGEEQGWQLFAEYLEKGMFNIRKRLGLERYQVILNAQKHAIKVMQSSGSVSEHDAWLLPLLDQYYDQMYSYQLSKKADRIVFKGDYQSVKAWFDTK